MVNKVKAAANVTIDGNDYHLLRRCRGALWGKYPGRFLRDSSDKEMVVASMHALLQLLESGGDIDFDRRPGSY